MQIGFIGFGLIGGSIARGLRACRPDSKLMAYTHRKEIPPGLQKAREDGVLDTVEQSLEPFKHCSLIFLCAPVLQNIAYLKTLKPLISPTCIVTDVGSVKGNIARAVKELGLESQFIGGHPMAGSEKTGYENSSGILLENAYYILTPTQKTPNAIVKIMVDLVQEIKAIPIVLDGREHDDITAAISHVPHIIASSLVNMVQESDGPEGKMYALAAGGFKDITRIASSSPDMWQDICLTNTESILHFLDQFEDQLNGFRQIIASGNKEALRETFTRAKDYRDSIPSGKTGAIDKIHEIYLDIIDEAGAIASLAALLASNGISIKNIGIIHNREFAEGVLRIELYSEEACEQASSIFTRHHYTIHKRK